jgi:DNA-binding MarR family transcriptional regulator
LAVQKLDAGRIASDLRIVIGGLIRRLRVENTLPISQGAVLSRLDREGPQTTSSLAAAEHVRPQSMAATVADLGTQSLVARRPHPLDRRQILIELTERGHEKLADDRRRREGWLAQAIGTLTPEEQETLVGAVPLIRRLTQL